MVLLTPLGKLPGRYGALGIDIKPCLVGIRKALIYGSVTFLAFFRLKACVSGGHVIQKLGISDAFLNKIDFVYLGSGRTEFLSWRLTMSRNFFI